MAPPRVHAVERDTSALQLQNRYAPRVRIPLLGQVSALHAMKESTLLEVLLLVQTAPQDIIAYLWLSSQHHVLQASFALLQHPSHQCAQSELLVLRLS
mgnify:CR=1 FL=1